MPFIYQLSAWPRFTWQAEQLEQLLGTVRNQQGRLLGRLDALGLGLRDEATLRILTLDAVKSSEIEGELLPPASVRSSLARRLGLDAGGLAAAAPDRRVEGVVAMLLDATQHHDQPLTAERLYGWQGALFPTGRSGLYAVQVGAWRTGAMQVVSGAMGQERVHFEAPEQLASQMHDFLAWFNAPTTLDAVLKAAVAHLWFVTIHPFDDGNGRIARAIADLQLARADGSAQRGYSLSAQIQAERTAYYAHLERTQRGDLDITDWLRWFLECLGRAVEAATHTLGTVLARARFWERHAQLPLNERQRRVLTRLLDGFEGKLTTSKWAKLAKCSQDTAGRDIQALLAQGVLARTPGGGRSTSYELTSF